ncbi:prephenate/arogenate dehydrogenase family protein [Phreatobacter aquaticus]|uniref:prephenate dehydrogenase n=1 Tax=Phreatobacter aquaticus TaxID=2570229 RepID=A0A4D7QH72_9HYPH|nr:prephenate/arogenate dehydrogenase family protein [Phreatobacter aquaticus]QCK84804.1 prephenate/arogenate dehydrogenase family protein [Phreatobacter aquaticus]
MSTEALFGQVTLIGIGLIGSSIARALKGVKLADRVVAADLSPGVIARVTELGIADEATTDLAAAVRQADLVICCVPVGAMGLVAEVIGPHLKPGCIVSDVGSTKGSIVAQMAPHMPAGVHLIPAHPVAGTEHSGPDSGFAALFQDRWCIITPVPGSDQAAVDKLAAFWQALGSKTEVMAPDHHDLVLAITSHVPHLIAYNIVGTASDLEQVTESEVIKFSAGGFRDFTRIAASDPTMWRDVFLHNKEAVLEVLGRFTEDLIALQRNIRWGQGDQLFDLFTRTRAIRRSIIDQRQDTADPDFGRGRK